MDKVDAVTRLLAETERAHGTYEGTVLGGVYDQQWPQWYAVYAVEHGIGDLLGHPVTSDALATFFADGWVESQRADPKPAAPWATYTASRIATDL